MSKKNIYMLQIVVSYDESAVYLPYSVGCIAAYAWRDDFVQEHYNEPKFIFRRDKIDFALAELDNPFLVALSNSVWNFEYNKIFAKKVKKKFPNCYIVFGGHQIPFGDSLLKTQAYIDILMHGEGEEPFTLLLKALVAGTDLIDVPNLVLRSGPDNFVTTSTYINDDISDYPSPYLSGMFDKLMSENPTLDYYATLETNRGCPYSCSFCDWCFSKKIRRFPMEKIQKEIQWISKHKIKYCYCADANFGILERDKAIASFVVEENKKNGFPQIFKPCYAKESDDTVFEAGKTLNENGIDKGVTIAYQTLCADALENINRKNLTLERFSNLESRYSQVGIPTYTELILGLPGESLESFCNGMCKLLESGQHNSMTVYTCQVYPQALMGQVDYQKKHGIKTVRVPMHGIHYTPNFNGVMEYYDIIVSTNTMDIQSWVKANMFSICLQCFHHLGLLRCFALYLRFEKKTSYCDFYNKLLDFLLSSKGSFCGDLFNNLMERMADTQTADWTYQKDVFGKSGWYFEEGAFLELAMNSSVFWKEIKPFLSGFNVDAEVFEDLLHYQQEIIRMPNINQHRIVSNYDFYTYFVNIYHDNYQPLIKQCNEIFVVMEKNITNWVDYAREIVWYGKRRSASLITNDREDIKIKFCG